MNFKKIYLTLRQFNDFLHIVNMRVKYFFASALLSVSAAFFEAATIGVLIPLANGIVKMDFSSAKQAPFFKIIINAFPQFFAAPRLPIFIMLVVAVFITSAIKIVLQYISATIAAYQIKRFGNELRKIIFKRYLTFGKLFFDRNNIGFLSNTVLNFVNFIVGQISGLETVLSLACMLLVYLGMMFFISYKLTIFIIILIPALNYSLRWLIKKIRNTSASWVEVYNSISNNIFNVLSCISLVKLYAYEEKEKSKFMTMSDKIQNIEFSIVKKQLLINPLQEIIVLVAILFLISFMAFMVGKDKTREIGSFLVYFYLLRRAQHTFINFNNMHSALATISGPMATIFNILDDKEKYIFTGGTKMFTGLQDKIEFNHLNFSYTPTVQVLDNINFSIEKGKMIAFVGPTGSGKTTIVNLLLRFYDCLPNSILIDKIDIREFTLPSLMAGMAVVSQDTLLFNDTFKNNIVYGLERPVSQDELNEIVKSARLHDFISSLPDGFNTYIGDKGMQLSGGERQRVSIARALLKRAEIIILDEATSSLDSKTERLIQESISEMFKGKTVIAIAHRLSTIKHADKIIVIEKGKLLEEGPLDVLLAQKGKFYEYWQEQKFY